jgi:hypothetical protein
MPIYEVDGVGESDGEINKVLPPKVYPAEIIGSEFKEITKEGSDYLGAIMLKLSVKCTCEDTGTAVTANDMVILPFPAAMDADGIRKSLAKLKTIQIATDTLEMGDQINNEEFLHTECRVELYIAPAKDGYPEQNKIRAYLPA